MGRIGHFGIQVRETREHPVGSNDSICTEVKELHRLSEP